MARIKTIEFLTSQDEGAACPHGNRWSGHRARWEAGQLDELPLGGWTRSAFGADGYACCEALFLLTLGEVIGECQGILDLARSEMRKGGDHGEWSYYRDVARRAMLCIHRLRRLQGDGAEALEWEVEEGASGVEQLRRDLKELLDWGQLAGWVA